MTKKFLNFYDMHNWIGSGFIERLIVCVKLWYDKQPNVLFF